MFYIFPYTTTNADTPSAPHKIEMELSAGIIHQVDVLFQKDCAHKVKVQIFQGLNQLWPSNTDESMKGDATVVSFREFHELKGSVNTLHALVWQTEADVLKEAIIQIGILPKNIIQPLSFDELVHAAAGLS